MRKQRKHQYVWGSRLRTDSGKRASASGLRGSGFSSRHGYKAGTRARKSVPRANHICAQGSGYDRRPARVHRVAGPGRDS
jgi:hypothetical protein